MTNQNVYVGNLTADPELRYTQSGLAVANFTIAVTEKKWSRQEGKFVDGDTTFIRGSLWREFAENVSATLRKGMRVIALGKLKQRGYETREGEKRTAFELEIDAIGPDLRWSTASVTRAQGSAHGGGQGVPAPAAQEPYAAPIAQESADWYANDETPF